MASEPEEAHPSVHSLPASSVSSDSTDTLSIVGHRVHANHLRIVQLSEQLAQLTVRVADLEQGLHGAQERLASQEHDLEQASSRLAYLASGLHQLTFYVGQVFRGVLNRLCAV